MTIFIRRCLALTPLFFLTACATTDFVTGQSVQNMYLIDEDIQMGAEVLASSIEEMKNEGVPVDRDKRRLKKIEEIVQNIGEVSHYPAFPYEVHLFQTNIVNAMCAPGGKVLVFSGLYDPKEGLVVDENDMAAVIGHEIAHATCRHVTETLTKEMPINALLAIAVLVAEEKGKKDLVNGLEAAFLVINGLVFPKYSREHEAESDVVGMMYMAKAGYDPRAAPRLWRRVHEREGSDPRVLIWLSSHPSNKDRWKNLEQHLPEALAVYSEVSGIPLEDLQGELEEDEAF